MGGGHRRHVTRSSSKVRQTQNCMPKHISPSATRQPLTIAWNACSRCRDTAAHDHRIAHSTVCPSIPGAPWLRTTFNSARAKLASDAASSSSRLASATLPLGPFVFLLLAFCSRKLRRSDASERSSFPPPEGLSANTRLNCRGPLFLNPSPPLLRWLSPASSLL